MAPPSLTNVVFFKDACVSKSFLVQFHKSSSKIGTHFVQHYQKKAPGKMAISREWPVGRSLFLLICEVLQVSMETLQPRGCWWFLCRLIKLGKTTPGFIRIFCFQYVPESTYEKNLVYETCMKTPKESFFNMVPSRLNLCRNIFIAHSITSASGLKNEISKTRGLHQQGLLYVHVNNITTIHRLIVIILKSFGGFV